MVKYRSELFDTFYEGLLEIDKSSASEWRSGLRELQNVTRAYLRGCINDERRLGSLQNMLAYLSTLPHDYLYEYQSAIKILKVRCLNNPLDFDSIYAILEVSLDELNERLKPGGFSTSGFMKEDDNFEDIIREDMNTLNSLNISHTQFADILSYINGQADTLRTDRPDLREVEPHFLIADRPYSIDRLADSISGYMGSQRCPFAPSLEVTGVPGGSYDCQIYKGILKWPKYMASQEAFQKHLKLPKKSRPRWEGFKNANIRFAGSMEYFIRIFGFFEGKGVQYRLDPIQFLEFFGIDDPSTFHETYCL